MTTDVLPRGHEGIPRLQARRMKVDRPLGMPSIADAPSLQRILVADDEAWFRTLLRRRLEAQGHNVACARDGNEALEILDREEFDRVFLDVMMPYHDGFEILKRIRRHPTKGGAWVALMTAMAKDQEVFEATATKPTPTSSSQSILQAFDSGCRRRMHLCPLEPEDSVS